ncbi:MAG: HlyD family efflux transporter periplasmic adaptor subunit [Mariprofundus sp.]
MLIMLMLFGCEREGAGYYQGYLEGDYLLVAPEMGGRIESLAVVDGQHVEKGAVLFVLDKAHAQLLVTQARARAAQATAQLNDLQTGARKPEISVVTASLRETKAELAQARRDVARLKKLAAGQFVSPQQLEQAETQIVRLQAAVDRLHAELKVVQLGGRIHRLAAAQAQRDAVDAALHDSERLLAETTTYAPIAGTVDRLILQAGELAGPVKPVLRFLPEHAVKLIFFVPETAVAGMHNGDSLSVTCDGCGPARTAHISRMASQAEYTPPVLFNRDNRSRLMFRMEGRLEDVGGLLPGLPVEVRIAP